MKVILVAGRTECFLVQILNAPDVLLAPRVAELHDEFARGVLFVIVGKSSLARRMYTLANFLPERNLVVCIDGGVVDHDASPNGYGVNEEMMQPTPPSAKLVSQFNRASLPWPS